MGTGSAQEGQVEPGTLPTLLSGGHSPAMGVTQLEAGDILQGRRGGRGSLTPS